MESEAEDRLIARLLGVTLVPEMHTGPAENVYLSDLSQELIDEGVGSLQLSKAHMDRALMARLMLPSSPTLQWPLYYLLDVYKRASNELRVTQSNKAVGEYVQEVALYAQELAISHAHLTLTMDLFPQTLEAQQRGVIQLLDAIDKQEGVASVPTPASAMPAGFLERFAAQYEEEGLSEIITSLVSTLNKSLLETSLVGDFQRPLQRLIGLANIPPIARTMTKLPHWAGAVSSGREVQTKTVLGPAFSITSIPDLDIFFGHPSPVPPPQPEAATTLFHNPEGRTNEIIQGVNSIRLTAQNVHLMQWNLIMAFLRPQGTREATLQWLALAVESNREHNKEMPDVSKASPRGLMLNLAAVLLKVCQPFLDPMSGKAWGKLDSRYVSEWNRLDFTDDTRLHLSAEEQAEARARLTSNESAESSVPFKPHFICECYFLTAKALHLGYIKAFDFWQKLARAVSEGQEAMQQLRQYVTGNIPQFQQALASRQLQAVEHKHARLSGALLCLQAQLLEKEIADSALAFYRLTATWLLRQASPSFANGLPPDLPLPQTAPESFKILPEFFISDLVELLKVAVQFPEVSMILEASPLNEVILFIIAFMPAGNYINNIYLRAQLGEVLGYLLPKDAEDSDRFPSRSLRRPRVSTVGASVAMLLDTNEVIQRSLVANLLQLFVEIERTGRHNQFYEKFEVRQDIGRILMYLWDNPTHREVWIRTAETDQDLYSRFNYFLETDATLHLDDALKLLQEERDFQNLPQVEQEQQQNRRNRDQRVRTLRFHLHYAGMMLRIIRMTTFAIWKSWLQPQAIRRVAGTLNYFLKYLTGPERRQLRVKDNENELRFDPKDLLTQIASIYINLARRDGSNVFAQAIAADKRSYYNQMFAEATQVLRHFGLLPESAIEELDRLALQTAAAVHTMEAEDAAEAEAPEEFFDPIMSEIMSNPVTLPSGVHVERESILRHMMSDPTDPFSRTPLTEADLKPNLELKARIQKWKAERSTTPMDS